MFPLGDVRPNCKESWIVSSVDKSVALYECARFKFKEKVMLMITVVINFMLT